MHSSSEDRPASETSQSRSREQTIERILDAAEELFADRAPDAVTVRDVAARAGVTHALIHNYIGSKEDLLTAALQRMKPSRRRVIVESPDLRHALVALIPDVIDTRLHSRMMVRSAMDGVEYVSLRERIGNAGALIDLAHASMESSEAGPRCSGIDPRIVVASVIAYAYGWVALESWLLPMCDLEDVDREELVDQIVDISGCIADAIFPPEDA